MERLFKYCTTADAVHSEERILELIGVVSFGVGKFNIALILGYNRFDAHLLTFADVVSKRPNTKIRAFVLIGPFLLSEENSIKHLKIRN